MKEALDIITVRNGFEPSESTSLKRVVGRVIRSIPAEVRHKCAFRLVRNGFYLSVNAGNHLVFRTPYYSDDGKRMDATFS